MRCKVKDTVCEVVCQLQVVTAAVMLRRMAVTVDVSLTDIKTDLHLKTTMRQHREEP